MIKIPDWLAKLPKNACVNNAEFAKVLGIKPKDLQNRLARQNIPTPKPDFNSKLMRHEKRVGIVCQTRGKNYWRAVTVRNYIRHLNRLELEKENDARTTKKPA